MSSSDPLLVPPRSPSAQSSRNDEEDALLTGQRTDRGQTRRRGAAFWREVGLFAWGLIATVAVIVLAVVYQHSQQTSGNRSDWDGYKAPTGKRNFIFMVSDGMGPASLSLTRTFRQHTENLPIDDVLVLDKHLVGTSRTRSSSSLITDSAAGATAFSCAKKSYNGAISVLPDHSPCGTVLEAAKDAGYMTGLVVTTRMTDATPACFSSHANMRSYEDLIAEHQIGEYPLGRMVDLMMGGGRCRFLPNTTEGSCRADNKDIVDMAKKKGFSYIHDRAGFDDLKKGSAVSMPLLGLFAPTDIPFEIDRRFSEDVYPSLEEMTRTALKALSDATKDSEQGFFILIEGSRIDHAGHGNDPAAQVHEVLAYDRAFNAVLEFLEQDSTPGVLVSTSDHETGGLAIARQLHESYPEYKWYPGVLANATHSSEYLEGEINKYLHGNGNKADKSSQRSYVRSNFVEKGLGIYDATDEELDKLIDAEGIVPPSYILADMISRRAQIGWASHGHSAVDVNIYASSPHDAIPVTGNRENIEVGGFMAEYLNLDLDKVTDQLRGVSTSPHANKVTDDSWMGPPIDDDVLVDELDTYHGEFKRSLRKRGVESSTASNNCDCGAH